MGKATVAGSYIGTHIIEASVSNNNIQSGDDSAGNIFSVFIDNSANDEAMYLKLFENASPTLGTTDPGFLFSVGSASTIQYDFPTGIAYSTALSFAVVKENLDSGTTGPDSAVIVRITIST